MLIDGKGASWRRIREGITTLDTVGVTVAVLLEKCRGNGPTG